LHYGIGLMKINMTRFVIGLVLVGNITLSQGDFNLVDLNPYSESYGQFIGPSDYLDDIVIIFFGHEY